LAVCLNLSTVINIKILTNSNQQTRSYKFTSHIAAFLSVVLITEMLEICIQTYDQNFQLILKSYLPVVYGTPLSAFLYDRLETGRIMWLGMAGGLAIVHTGFRTITLVLYIGSLPSLTTRFPCGRGRTLFIFGSLGQRSRSLTINRIVDNRVVSA
jgi:uncharacterized membrane protein